MKKIKFILVALTLSLFALQSCQDDGPVTPPQPEATKSIALRTVLNKIKSTNDASGRYANTSRTAADNDDFCFDFVYPFQLEYNTGALVTIESFDGLIEVLMNESADLYIIGIVFPFDIVLAQDGTTVTINSEEDFIAVLESCEDFDVWDDEDVVVDCFTFVYPIDMIAADGSTVTINSDDELMTFLEAQGAMYEPDFVFPITVTNLDGDEIVVTSIYDFFELLDACYAYDGEYDDCDCYAIYDPVCVYDADYDMTIPFPNECVALCEGFTEADFVDCNGLGEDEDCDIENIEVTVGDCINDGWYELTLDFDYSTTQTFEVLTTSYTSLGTYSTADLPVNIDFPGSGMEHDQIFVNSIDNVCWDDLIFEAPECAVNEFFFMDYLDNCVGFVYPIEVSYGAVTYEVYSYVQLGQYFDSPASTAEIIFPVDITVTETGETITVNNMEELEEAIDENCN